MSVSLVVNCYERTYRQVLAPGYFPAIEQMNDRTFEQVLALINNVDDPREARDRAETLVDLGEISGFEFVSDWVPAAMQHWGLGQRHFRRRPYLLDYGLVMPLVASSEYILGWDAETVLEEPADWVSPSLNLLKSDSRILHASLNWPPARPQDAGVEGDAVARVGDFLLSWGFSDQVFLVSREKMFAADLKTFSPAAIARHAPHPYTFEFRMESYQRAHRKLRATYAPVRYRTNLQIAGVLDRTGKSRYEAFRTEALHRLEYHVTRRLPSWLGPRWARNATVDQARSPQSTAPDGAGS
ncbi:hypothetical protein [Ornithinimicrobium cerasi]|uniref:hypothetical protein n=1 Tax=Ornithinimicrobium cerasi TaxID=2248773 RepID=UPI000F00258A|nr:hypothetical protein [Ornithinimicrobium cerasi]